MSGFVYLIEAQIGVLKIGVAQHPRDRLSMVRTHSPVPVRLIAQWPGTYADEQALHARFLEYRSHCEWFRIEGELLKFVAERLGEGLSSVEPWSHVLLGVGEGRKKAIAARRSATLKALWADPGHRIQRARDKYFQALMAPLRIRAANREGPLTGEVFDAAQRQVDRDFTFIGPRLPEISLPQREFEKNSHRSLTKVLA